jgi:hypothetical protein
VEEIASRLINRAEVISIGTTTCGKRNGFDEEK